MVVVLWHMNRQSFWISEGEKKTNVDCPLIQPIHSTITLKFSIINIDHYY